MSIEERFFSLDGQWNTIHLPERPNGFAVFVFGDYNHFVDNRTSLWKQNSDRYKLIETLKEKGYTVFYSHLYGRNWGSEAAVTLAKRVYRYVLKYEILNSKIHILAEGMGALAAINFINEMQGNIRSAIFINPCLDLKGHFQQEKQNQLFLKRIRKEISQAYGLDPEQIDSFMETVDRRFILKNREAPLKIFHDAAGSIYPFKIHGRPFEKRCMAEGLPVSLIIQMPGKSFESFLSIFNFYSQYEEIL